MNSVSNQPKTTLDPLAQRPFNMRRFLTNGTITATGVCFFLWDLLMLYSLFFAAMGHDFARIYASAAAFLHGKTMYGWTAATPMKVADSQVIDLWNMNPPHFHLVMLPLALIPWRAALAVSLAIGVASLAWSLRLILGAARVRLTPRMTELGLIAALGFSGTATVASTGQFSLLLLLPVTLIWLEARRGRWIRSGLYLGLCLSVKPFLAFLLPYYVLSQRWAATGAAVIATLSAFALGALVFGVENTQAWYRGLATVGQWDWLPLNASLLGALDRTFTRTLFFEPVAVLSPGFLRSLWMVIGGMIGIASLLAAPRGQSGQAIDRAFALLLVTSLLLCPLGWVYYFWLPMGPIIALTTDLYREAKPESAPSLKGIWRIVGRVLPIWAVPGVFLPMWFPTILQPSGLMTVLIGNIYSWTLIGVWGRLLVLAVQTSVAANPSRPTAHESKPVGVCGQFNRRETRSF